VKHLAGRALAAFDVENSARGVRRPQPLALPAGLRIVDASIEALGEEPDRIGHTEGDELAVSHGHQRIFPIAGGDRHVLPQPESVELIDPVVVAGLGAAGVGHALELRRREGKKRPAFRTVLPGGGRTVERPFALAPVEAGEMSAGEDGPDYAVTIDVETARREPLKSPAIQLTYILLYLIRTIISDELIVGLQGRHKHEELMQYP